ncbi:DUF6481 family protein [Methylocapsa acidiphila]|uniref:DUF6481 family protein n=1 Tax=Methylocapsa acidiphila TaxID=133552 RepID=UPI0004172CCD|nr:DUF6481 family protein [Methylocapsa acidiphila]
MSNFREKGFVERRSAAVNAVAARLTKFRAKPGPDDPAVLAREAERKAILEARKIREAQRAAATCKQLAREAAERAEREAALEAERIAAEEATAAEQAAKGARLAGLAARVIADEAARKAARDQRYAARKARQN